MGIAALIIGIAALVLFLFTLIPFLGWLNWIVIPLAVVGAVLAILGMTIGLTRRVALWALVLNALVVILGILVLA